MSDRLKEGAGPGSSAQTNQGKNANKRRNNSNRNKKKNLRLQEANEAKEKAKVAPQSPDVETNTSGPGDSVKDKAKAKAVTKSQDNKNHTSEKANPIQAKEVKQEMDEESIENNSIAFDTASSNGGTSQQESQNNSSEFYSATEEEHTIIEPENVDDIGEARTDEDLEVNENKLINSDSLNEKQEEIEECEQNQTIVSSPVLSEGPQEEVNLGKDASEEFNLKQGREFDYQEETKMENNLEKDVKIENLQKGIVTQEEINLENETLNESNIDKGSNEQTKIEPEAKEDLKLQTEKQEDLKLQTEKQEDSKLETEIQDESTLENDTQEEPMIENGTQEEPTLEQGSQEESTLEQGSQEEPTLVQGSQEEPTPQKCAQLEPCLENGTQEEMNHENEVHDESNNKKWSHDKDNTETETQKVSNHEKELQESNEIEELIHTTTDMDDHKETSNENFHQIVSTTPIRQDGANISQITLSEPEQSEDTSKDDIGNSSRNTCQPEKKSKKRNKSRNKSKSKKSKMTPSVNDYDTSQKKDMDISSPTSRDKCALDANGVAKLNIDRSRIVGLNRGIDGANNSCYMDATLFSLFYCTDVFDETLLNENSCKGRQTSFNRDILTILRDKIVYSLRHGYFCPRESMKKLRQAMKSLSPKICGSFMDAEEFIFLLFEKSLNVNEFIYYTAGTSDFMHQIFVEKEDKDFATVQELYEKSMKNCDDLKLQSVPKPALILEMPRSNRVLIHHKGIVPSLSLDLTDIVVQCALDSSQATSENSHANVAANSSAVMKSEQSSIINKKSSYSLLSSVKGMIQWARSTLSMFSYCPRLLQRPRKFIGSILYFVFIYTPIFVYALWRPENAVTLFNSTATDTSNSKTTRSFKRGQNDVESCSEEPDKKVSVSSHNIMDLIAIICIRGCHYTSFVKCDGNSDTPLPTWLFFDSMSGGGPEVEEVLDFEKWIKRLEKEPENIPLLWEEMPWGVRRAITDSHICIYKSSNPSVTVETAREK